MPSKSISWIVSLKDPKKFKTLKFISTVNWKYIMVLFTDLTEDDSSRCASSWFFITKTKNQIADL